MAFCFRSLLVRQLPRAFGNLALPIGFLHGLLGPLAFLFGFLQSSLGDLTPHFCLGAEVLGNRSLLLCDCLGVGKLEAETPILDKRDADSSCQTDHEEPRQRSPQTT